jgi:hypothetical protein
LSPQRIRVKDANVSELIACYSVHFFLL